MSSFGRKLFSRLPWHLQTSVRLAYKNWKHRNPPFAPSPYSSFEAFPTRIATTEAEQAIEAERGVRAAIQGDIDAATPLNRFHRNHDLLPLCVAMLRRELGRPVSVLDFGGAAGIDYASIKHAVGNETDVQYTVIEFAPVCEVGRRVWEGDARIRFIEDLSKAEDNYDIVYAWGSIHYLPNPIDFLGKLAKKAERAVLIVGTCFAKRQFLRAQINQSVSYPQWVISLTDTERALNEIGFELAFRAAGVDEYNVENFDAEDQVSRSACLLFLRR